MTDHICCSAAMAVPNNPTQFVWPNRHITWSIVPEGLHSNLLSVYKDHLPALKQAIQHAFDLWHAACPSLTFSQVSDDGTKNLGQGKIQGDPRWGDMRIFGTPQPTSVALGDGYYPNPYSTKGGDVDINTAKGVYGFDGHIQPDFLSVFLHESGHGLGLVHSTVPTAVMYPTIRIHTALDPDDVKAINIMYPKV